MYFYLRFVCVCVRVWTGVLVPLAGVTLRQSSGPLQQA